MSLSAASLGLGSREMATGLSYVGASRVTSLEGLRLVSAVDWPRLQAINAQPRLRERRDYEAVLLVRSEKTLTLAALLLAAAGPSAAAAHASILARVAALAQARAARVAAAAGIAPAPAAGIAPAPAA
jgi:hypothetical protein